MATPMRSLVVSLEFLAAPTLIGTQKVLRHAQHLHIFELLEILGTDMDVRVPTTSCESQFLRGHRGPRFTINRTLPPNSRPVTF